MGTAGLRIDRLVPILLVVVAPSLGCSDDESQGSPRKHYQSEGCAPGELTTEAGACQPAGLPTDMPCAPGQIVSEGGCGPAGVPPDACAVGFLPDGANGC